MAKEALHDLLPYGQFGQALYDDEKQTWLFERAATRSAILRPLKDLETIVSASKAAPLNESSPGITSWEDLHLSRRLEKQSQLLVQTDFQLQPTTRLLQELARGSEAIEQSVSRHDPSFGSLIECGRVYDERRKRIFPVVAFATGSTGGDLCIAQTTKECWGWPTWSDAFFNIAAIGTERATWRGPGVSIRSITFGLPHGRGGAYLAVRLITEIVVFRPVLRKASPSSSRLDFNMVLRLDTYQFGGSPFADVGFSPWCTRRLVTVDENSSFVVWELQYREGGRAEKRVESSLEHGSFDQRAVSDDGWHRAFYFGSPATIVVCNRRNIIFAGTESGADPSQKVDLGLDNATEWILDCKLVSSTSEYLLVLTSTSIILLNLRGQDRHDTSLRVVGKVRHFRNVKDITLRLCVSAESSRKSVLFSPQDVVAASNKSLELNRPEVVVLLRSALVCATAQYRFKVANGDLVAITGPDNFVISSAPQDDCDTTQLMDLTAMTIPVSRELSDHLKVTIATQDLSCLHLLRFLCKDLSVRQALCVATIEPFDLSGLGAPTRIIDRHASKRRSRNTDAEFIADSDSKMNDESHQILRPISKYVRQRKSKGVSLRGQEWTTSYEFTLQRLNEVTALGDASWNEITTRVESETVRHESIRSASVQSLKPIMKVDVEIPNLDHASAQLEQMTLRGSTVEREEPELDAEDLDRARNFSWRPIASASFFSHLGIEEASGMTSTPEAISQHLLSTQLESLSETMVTARGNLARQIAADIALASHIRVEDSSGERGPEPKQEYSQSKSEHLPSQALTATPRTTDSPDSTALLLRDQHVPSRLATPTPSAVSSTETSTTTHAATAEISRLAKYIIFSNPSAPPSSRTTRRILSHWQLGADPNVYDWLSVPRASTDSSGDDDDDEAGAPVPKEREHKRRRQERHAKRQRREAEQSERMQRVSSQVPTLEIVSASQPTATVDHGGGSQGHRQTPAPSSQAQPMYATQILPGRHGGRGPARKKRKEGF